MQVLSPHAATNEVQAPWSPYSTTRDATVMRNLALQLESGHHSPQLEKSQRNNKDPANQENQKQNEITTLYALNLHSVIQKLYLSKAGKQF